MSHHIVEMFEAFHAALREQVANTPEDKAVRELDRLVSAALAGSHTTHIADHAAYHAVAEDIRVKSEGLRAALQARTDETLPVKALMAFEPVLSEIRQLAFAHEAQHAAPAAPVLEHHDAPEAAPHVAEGVSEPTHETAPHHQEAAVEPQHETAHVEPHHVAGDAEPHQGLAHAAPLAELTHHAETAVVDAHAHAEAAAADLHGHADAAIAVGEHAGTAPAHAEPATEAHAPSVHPVHNGVDPGHGEVAHAEQTFPQDDALAKRIAELEAELSRARAKLA